MSDDSSAGRSPAGSARPSRLRLRLVLDGGDGVAPRPVVLGDVEARFHVDACVGDLVEVALAELAPASLDLEPASFTCRLATGRLADRSERLRDLGILHGDRVLLTRDDLTAQVACRPTVAVDTAPLRLVPLAGVPAEWGGVLDAQRVTVGRSARRNSIVIGHPSVSREHARFDVGSSIVLHDLGSTNGTRVDGELVVGRRVVDVGAVIRFGDVTMEVQRSSGCDVCGPGETAVGHGAELDELDELRPVESDVDGCRPVHRPPRIAVAVPSVTLRAPEVPVRPVAHRLAWISALVPVLLAVVVVGAMALGADTGLSGGYALVSVLFLMMSPIMILASYWEAKRDARRSARLADADFDRAMGSLRAAVADSLTREREARLECHAGPAALHMWASERSSRLWERASGDRSVRLGLGALSSRVTVDRPAGGDGPHLAAIEDVARSAATVDAVPVVVEIGAVSGLAVVGPTEARLGIARWLVLQMATTLPPSVLSIDVVSAHDESWAWTAWLPHARSEAETRLVVIDDDGGLGAEDVATLAAAGGSADTLVVWLGDDRADAPATCDVVFDGSEVVFASTGDVIPAVTADAVDSLVADRWARRLAPLVEEVAAGSAARPVPPAVGLAEVLGLSGEVGVDAERIRDGWAHLQGSVTAVIGCGADGPVRADLRADGPHVLVAGTTGAGKSELLQTLVAGMAARHPPSRVTFLLVDYKGGAAFGDCAALPHTVGLVTDLDDGLAARMLVSLRSELRRREQVLAVAGANDLASLEAMSADTALPSLVVVVDEFASIAADVPHLMEGMIDIARRGRSLGIHLVLATQRPAGVVNEQLRANTNLRIALRVADEADSTDIVGVANAAAIDRANPGRAFVRFGAGDLVEVQTAFGGRSSTPPADTAPDADRPVLLSPLRPAQLPHSVVPAPDRSPTTSELDVVVAAVRRAAMLDGLPRPRRPWLPPLPERVPLLELVDLATPVAPTSFVLAVGALDDPARQHQGLATVDLEQRGSMILYATSPVGTDAARSLTVCAGAGRLPRDVRVDVIDGAARPLAALEELPHVGSVIGNDEGERVGRLIRDLQRHARGGRGEQRRLLVVNDLIGFSAAFDPIDGGRTLDAVGRLVSEGVVAGVHVVAVSDRRVGVPLSVSAGIGARVVAAMHSVDDVVGLGVDPAMLHGPPGRAVLDGHVVQLATVPTGAAWDELVARERRRCGDQTAAPIGVLPTVVHIDATDRTGPADIADSGRVAMTVGIADDDLGPVVVALERGDGNVLIAGPLRSGRSTTLATLAATLPTHVRRVLVAARPSRRGSASWWDESASGADAARMADRLRRKVEAGADGPIVVFVDDATDLDDDVDAALTRLSDLSRDHHVHLVVAAEAALARVAYGGLVAAVRRSRRAILLQPDVELDGDLVGVRLPSRHRGDVPPGRGELVDRGRVTRVQVAVASKGDVPHIAGSDASVR